MLKREENHVFAAPVEAVVARWTDADFLTGMMQDQGSREISVTVEHLSSDQIVVALTRQGPGDAPAMIRAVIGQCLLTLTGNADGGATCAAIVSVQSRAPMVAAMVESLMLEDSTKLLRQEFAAVDAASG